MLRWFHMLYTAYAWRYTEKQTNINDLFEFIAWQCLMFKVCIGHLMVYVHLMLSGFLFLYTVVKVKNVYKRFYVYYLKIMCMLILNTNF